MSFLTQDEISSNHAMRSRIAQCAAGQHINDPDGWTDATRRSWAAAPGWDAAWESAQASGIDDPGVDEAVINDEMILSQVQAMTAAP
jgi:hypothetical protein